MTNAGILVKARVSRTRTCPGVGNPGLCCSQCVDGPAVSVWDAQTAFPGSGGQRPGPRVGASAGDWEVTGSGVVHLWAEFGKNCAGGVFRSLGRLACYCWMTRR